MFGLGAMELFIILGIVLVVFGARKLPEIGEGLGKGIKSFQKSMKSPEEIGLAEENQPESEGKS